MLSRDEIAEILLNRTPLPGYLRWWAAMAWGLCAVACVAVLHEKLLLRPPEIKPPFPVQELEGIILQSSMPDGNLRNLVFSKFMRYREIVDHLLGLTG